MKGELNAMLVLDCSAAVSMVFETTEGKAFSSLMLRDERVIAPDLYIAEINSAFAKHVRAGQIDTVLAHKLISQSLDLIDEFVDMRINYIEAFDEGVRNNHSTYDMFYLTLARRNGATLFTLDKKLIALCEELQIDCVHMIDRDESK